MRSVLKAALEGHKTGLSIIAVRADGSKEPLGKWKSYQSERADQETICTWLATTPYGLGCVAGAVSGGLEIIDFDDAATYDLFLEAAAAVELDGIVERIRAGYEERTPGGGAHLPYRCSIIAGNTKLASRPKAPGEMQHPKDTIKVLIETRGEGGYCILAPSNGRVHPNGGAYTLTRGSLATIAAITPDERRQLWALAQSFDRMPVKEETHPGASGVAANVLVNRPGDDFTNRATWADILKPQGWTLVHAQNGVEYWRRPGKGKGWSATANYAGTGLLYVFSSSTEFESERGYSKFSAYALLNHAGDFAAAAKELVQRGYGVDRTFSTSQNGHPPGVNGNGNAPPTPPAAESPKVLPADEPHLTDLGNALRLVAQHGTDLRYNYLRGKWFIWDGRHWAEDTTGEIVRRAKNTVRSIYAEAAAAVDDKERRAIADHARRSEAEARIKAMIGLAQSEPGIAVTFEEFDVDPWLLNVENGTIDLRSGQLRPHSRADLITKRCPVAYDPAATCPTFDAFLSRIFEGKDELKAFVQRLAGYTATGRITERVLPILFGNGSNGKTTLIETLQALLTDYSYRTPIRTILTKKDDAIPNDLARLKGARFVFAAEANEGRRLDEAQVKDLTGGDTITARFMRGEWFDFRPEFKIWLSTNHKPVIRGTDEAIWDRIRLIPFSVRIPDEEKDRTLPDKLRLELPGILNWVIAGCLAWQRDGLGIPEDVKKATAAYREEMDALANFFADRCTISATARVSAKELYAAYVAWCEEGGERPISQRIFGSRLSEKGYERTRGGKTGAAWIIGLGLAEPTDRSDPSDPNFGISTPIATSHVETLKKGSEGSDRSDQSSQATLPGSPSTQSDGGRQQGAL